MRELSEDEAEGWLELLELLVPGPRQPVGSDEEQAALEAISRLDAGEGVQWSEVKRRLGIVS